MIRDEVVDALLTIGVSGDLAGDLPELPEDLVGLLVYGSQARGDAVQDSDLDLLGLVPTARPSASAGDVNVSFYTAEQLSSGIGTLFGFHLKRDAMILFDDQGHLRRAAGGMGEVDADRLLDRVRIMSQLFTSPERDLPMYLMGLLRQARYLLRSCLYAQAIAIGEPCFSVRELSVRHRDTALVSLLASRQATEPTCADYRECLLRLRGIIGEFPPSEHGSLEATVVNEWEHASDVLSMAFMALGASGKGEDYAEVEKILL